MRKLDELERIQEIERQTYENIIEMLRRELIYLDNKVRREDETTKDLLKVELDGALEENEKLRAQIERLKKK